MQDVAGTRKISANHTTGNELNNCKKIFWQYIQTYKLLISIMPPPIPLTVGQKAPAFSYAEGGSTIHSSEITSPYLIYFYPKDDTPGCTKEACAIRDTWADFEAAGLKVIGVSKDTERSHQKFQDKYALPFPLIADTQLELANAFGVFGEKKFMGRIYDGIHRMSFLVAADGRILTSYPKVKPEAHAAQVLEDFFGLTS
ncbi:MAG: thioredoxin-dependent thiol peroxidase [Opitutae bacterium]|jgi:peroxiredoxin Q/BCP|nr:thioredoxin-dependent thiol peroxidase [Opitutae bacterium]MDG1301650.1 thioredoxin-dependent thiol peroxidase [Opitutae bacterium]